MQAGSLRSSMRTRGPRSSEIGLESKTYEKRAKQAIALVDER